MFRRIQCSLLGCVFFVSSMLFGLFFLNLDFRFYWFGGLGTKKSDNLRMSIQEIDNELSYEQFEHTTVSWYNGITIEEWNTITKGKEFIYYDGFESLGGNRLVYLHLSIHNMTELCRNTVGCIGFNTQGLLMDTLLPFTSWTHLESKGGLHVLDDNYCNFPYKHRCPLDSYCLSISQGRYICQLKEIVDNIHVVISVDENESQGLLPLLQSLKRHHTKHLEVHIVVSSGGYTHIKEMISCGIRPSENFMIDTVTFDVPDHLMKLVTRLKKGRGYLKSSGNYARFYFDQLFPNLTWIIYLDVDTIVLHDIRELWKEVVATEKLLVVIPRRGAKLYYGKSFKKLKKAYKERYDKDINLHIAPFNAGVFGINLKKWRERELMNEVIYWMKANTEVRLWGLGTQPVMHVVCYDDWKHVNSRWNIERLGASNKSSSTISNGYLLHWSGPFKPWLINGTHKNLWEKYNYGLCSRSGTCLEGNGGICKCHNGFQGDLCENKLDL